ncbi:flavodoxin family protein [Clostridium sp. D33t1_170424_F3]|uniref:flavodoxin family protein n=1 Tax=Clostridium sp. D33t1_170424_F3 TaxID=2787099 RepID=UPI0018AC01B1|nr:flavodoxin family protein [Clostridium sp. D33t1_170424_F3]
MKALLINASSKKNGNTARLVGLVADAFQEKGMQVETLCLGEQSYSFCKGCRSCYQTAECVQQDDVQKVLGKMADADVILIASPDYWGDVTGHLKVFMDRCTPYSKAHQPYAALPGGKRGISIALSAGEDPRECKAILMKIENLFRTLGIKPAASFYTCGILTEQDLERDEGKLAEAAFFASEIAKALVP